MGTIAPPYDVPWRVADALARAVALGEAIADGALDYAEALAERLELDLIALRVLIEEKAA
jgi:hypothetical protein